jgi:hypothetical protein
MLALSCLFNDTVVLCMKARVWWHATGLEGAAVLDTQSVELGMQRRVWFRLGGILVDTVNSFCPISFMIRGCWLE